MRIPLLDAAVVEIPAPKVFPENDQGYLEAPHGCYNAPAVYVATISDGIIYGGTNLIFTKDGVICHDLYDSERDYTSEELHGRTLIDPRSLRIRWLMDVEIPENIPSAAVFVDACASNYAHWLTEVLPRIAAFCSNVHFKSVPLVVNDGLHKNIMESLFAVAGMEREIVLLRLGYAIQVETLYVTSVAGYVPFDRRNSKLTGHSHGVFNPHAFELLQNKIFALANKTAEQDWPKKIYLRRNLRVRKVTNAAEIEKLMISRGYAIIEIEKFTFLQQVQLFQNAKEIFSATGAVLSNAIFCRPGTQVAVLMAKHQNMIYRYWSNMLTPLGINVGYVLGNIVKKNNIGIHGDFTVDAADVIYLLDAMERK